MRVYFVQSLEVDGLGTIFVTSAFTDVPLIEAASEQPCNWRFDQLCSLAYTRRVLGDVTTAMLRSSSPATLSEVFARVTWREYNQQASSADAGFYPFIYTVAGQNVAHGANPTLLSRTLPAIINGSEVLRSLVDGTVLNQNFVDAAALGGGWTGYYWRNSLNEEAYLKIAFISGVRCFGTDYYIGVGFNHQMPPAALGPHCAECIAAKGRTLDLLSRSLAHSPSSLTHTHTYMDMDMDMEARAHAAFETSREQVAKTSTTRARGQMRPCWSATSRASRSWRIGTRRTKRSRW